MQLRRLRWLATSPAGLLFKEPSEGGVSESCMSIGLLIIGKSRKVFLKIDHIDLDFPNTYEISKTKFQNGPFLTQFFELKWCFDTNGALNVCTHPPLRGIFFIIKPSLSLRKRRKAGYVSFFLL